MDLKKKSKAFSRLALKEKIFLLKKTKALATLGKELEKVGSLKIKLSKLVSDENLNDSPTTASQLKANKFYSHKIHEELSQKGLVPDSLEAKQYLINRAKEVLITMAMEISTDEGDSGDLMSVEGMEMTLALELSQKGINDREDLAEQSIEELTSIIDISEEDAGDLIMRARAHWFED